MTTYTAEQIAAIGGIHRVHLPDTMIADMIGLDAAALDGRVYWEDGQIHITGALGEHAEIIRTVIADLIADVADRVVRSAGT